MYTCIGLTMVLHVHVYRYSRKMNASWHCLLPHESVPRSRSCVYYWLYIIYRLTLTIFIAFKRIIILYILYYAGNIILWYSIIYYNILISSALCDTASPCLNEGTCLPNHNKMCDCQPQFTGTYCESSKRAKAWSKPVTNYGLT